MRTTLKMARHAAKIKQREIAAILGITEGYYQQIEAGVREGKAYIWDRLEDLLGVPQRQLRDNYALPQSTDNEILTQLSASDTTKEG